MDLTKLMLTFVSSFLAGGINSIAGGGTLLTFPVLLALGMDGKIANATSTLGLWPASISSAWGYRREVTSGKKDLALFLIPSILGGIIGAQLLTWTGSAAFDSLVPWLILAATVLFIVQEPIRRAVAQQSGLEEHQAGWLFVVPSQFFVAIYGGYFGAGIGILMLASLGLLGIKDIHHRNGIKNLAGTLINGVAIALFIYGRLIDWQVAGVMALGSIAGGYLSVGFARRIGQKRVQIVVVLVGLLGSLWTFLRLLFGST